MLPRAILPEHIAIIMDGNGRWAKLRRLPRTRGHMEGVKRVEEIVHHAARRGIKVLTIFAFSSENWYRPQTEVSVLMKILLMVLKRKVRKLHEGQIRIRFLGRISGVPKTIHDYMEAAVNLTEANTGMILNVAFNYGSRLEIIDAVREIARQVESGGLKISRINEELFSDALYTRGLPDPDLLIRTSGEKRISNFLLWQLSYAELYFTEKFWPEFTVDEFDKALVDFQNRERRYGRLSR